MGVGGERGGFSSVLVPAVWMINDLRLGWVGLDKRKGDR